MIGLIKNDVFEFSSEMISQINLKKLSQMGETNMGHIKWLKKFKEEEEKNYRKKVINALKKIGLPLEFFARNILSDYGFDCAEAYYTDIDKNLNEITRQIDIIGYGKTKQLETTNEGVLIYLQPIIITECKYSSNKDIFLFEISDENKDNILVRFPIFTNGTSMIFEIHGNTYPVPTCTEFFDIPDYTTKLTDVNLSKLKNLQKEKDNSKIFFACEQIMAATNHFYKKYSRYVNTSYKQFWEKNQSLEELKNLSIDMFNGTFFIYLFVPMLIVSEDYGLIKVVPKYDENKLDLEELGYCFYLHVPSHFKKYSKILENRYSQSILVCNISYLEDCLNKLNSGIEKIKEKLEKNVASQPSRIFEDMDEFTKNLPNNL